MIFYGLVAVAAFYDWTLVKPGDTHILGSAT